MKVEKGQQYRQAVANVVCILYYIFEKRDFVKLFWLRFLFASFASYKGTKGPASNSLCQVSKHKGTHTVAIILLWFRVFYILLHLPSRLQVHYTTLTFQGLKKSSFFFILPRKGLKLISTINLKLCTSLCVYRRFAKKGACVVHFFFFVLSKEDDRKSSQSKAWRPIL